MNLWIELRYRFDVIIPTGFFSCHPLEFDSSHPACICLANVVTHESAIFGPGQLHCIHLCSEEWDLGGLADSSLDLVIDFVTVRLVLVKDKRCRIYTTLEVLVRHWRIECTAPLVGRALVDWLQTHCWVRGRHARGCSLRYWASWSILSKELLVCQRCIVELFVVVLRSIEELTISWV